MFSKKIVTVALLSSLAGFSLATQANNAASITLQGLVTSTTCAVDVNGVSGGTTVDTQSRPATAFTANAHNLTGALYPMKISLSGCLPSGETDDVAGHLVVTGNVAANGASNIFIGSDADTGFMVLKQGGTTSADAVKNNTGVPVTVNNAKTDYTFKVGMASTVAAPDAAVYTAPITVSFAAE